VSDVSLVEPPPDGCILVWRPNLELRLNSLEKRLKIPEADRYKRDGGLQKPQTIEVRADRVDPTKFDSHGRPINEENLSEAGLHSYMSITKKDSSQEKKLEEVSTLPGIITSFSLMCRIV